jgi:uncharacterized repeat protein (TIGR03843 family)
MDTNTDLSRRPHAEDEAMEILRRGEAEVKGLFRLGSNDTFLCEVRFADGSLRAVYKPARGERPLWDFPAGSLGKREAAAYEMSRLLGWDFVPPTVFRDDGPLGAGSFQEYLNLDLGQNYFQIRDQDPDTLRRVAVFDVLINNADRKATHVARDSSGAVRLIDHGVCFHREWKLRTVIWDFAEQALPEGILRLLEDVLLSGAGDRLRNTLVPLISRAEIRAVESRAEALCKAGCFPSPGPGVSIPWPIWG